MKIRYPLAWLACLACCISCSPNVYIPNQVNAPLLHEKHQLKVNVAPSNWQAAYAVTNNFAVMVNGQYTWEKTIVERPSSKDWGRGDFSWPQGGVIEAGAGVFKKFTHRNKPLVVLDLYLGYGAGGFKMLDEWYYGDSARTGRRDYTVRTSFRKFFIQPGFGMVKKNVEIAFTPRFTFLRYANPYVGSKVSEYYNAWISNREVTYLPDMREAVSGSIFLFEPAFTLRAGGPRVKWHFQLTGCAQDVFEGNEYYFPISITMGLTAAF
jgi:hypothetical protein